MNAETFISKYHDSVDEADALLGSPSFRESIYQCLHPTPSIELLLLVRDLFQREIRYREEYPGGDYFENLYWTALFLYQMSDLEDVLPMWRAKSINMDSGAGFDVQFLVGSGVDRTLAFLKRIENSDASAAADASFDVKPQVISMI